MRKTFGISIAASLALMLAGCGDDSSCEGSCGSEPDAAMDDETESDETETDKDTETSDDSEAGTPTETDTETDEPVEAGTSTETDPTDTSLPDAGPSEDDDAGSDEEEEEAGTAPTDGGPTTDEPTEAGPVEDPDAATDGGGSSAPTACEQACATAAEKGCDDNSTCEMSICGIRDVNPNCLPEADAYLECMAASDPQDAFVCGEDGTPQYVSSECNDPVFNAWVACLDANP
jgi:hypothetical protein